MTTPRSINSGTITFGLVSIPFKLYTAVSPVTVSFNQINKVTGNRVQQQLVDAVTKAVVPRDQIVKGYEYEKDKYVLFTPEELESLDAEKTDSIEILEFISADSLDTVSIEKSYYVGADKGGQKAYALLARTMEKTSKVAVARYVTRGREQLVVLRPYRGGLLLSYMHYTNEIRNFEEVRGSTSVTFTDEEIAMAEKLVDRYTTGRADLSKYSDGYVTRVAAAVQTKISGNDLPTAAPAPVATVTDLFEALKKSLLTRPDLRA